MGELIEFKKGPSNVWDDAGEAFPEEDTPDSPRPGLMILPILLFLDGFSIALALVCRPVAATVPLLAGVVLWAALRDGVGFGIPWALGFCFALWLIAHVRDRNIDQLIKGLESAEADAMRTATQRNAALGRALHLALYLYVAAFPVVVAALAAGVIPAPHWLPRSLAAKPIAVPPLLVLGLALLPAAAAVTTRYYWHPVARHATLLGGRRKFTVAARAEAA